MKLSVKLTGAILIAAASVSAHAQFFQGLIDSVKNANNALAAQSKTDSKNEAQSTQVNPNIAVSKVAVAYSTGALKELEEGVNSGTINANEMIFPASKKNNYKSICSFPAVTVEDIRGTFKDSSGMLIPVYKLRRPQVNTNGNVFDFGLEPDWGATEKLHKSMLRTAGIRLLPLTETKKFDALLQAHLSRTLINHFKTINKSLGSDGGMFPMLANMNKDQDASDHNRQISGPFNDQYHSNVLSNFQNASYLISTSDSKILTAYFSALIHNMAGSSDKFPVPNGADYNSVTVIKSVWNSYLASYGYLVGYSTQKEAEDAAVGSGLRLVSLTGEGLRKQWQVLAPELAAAGGVLDTHALARGNHIGLLSVTPVEVFSKMSALGFNSTKLQCIAFEKNQMAALSKTGEVAMQIWGDVEKESNPILGIMVRGDQGPQPNSRGGCVGWGCTRTVDLVRDKRFKDLSEVAALLPSEKQPVNTGDLNEMLVDSLSAAMSQNEVSGAIGSSKLK